MGSIFTRHRNAVSELEQIVLKLEKLHSRSIQLRTNRYNFLWWLTALFLFISSTYSGILCVKDAQPRYPLVFLTWLVGATVLLIVRFAMTRTFEFILRRDERKMMELNTKRSQIIEQVKEKETFKVAKEIIEKFGSPDDLLDIGVRTEKNKKVDSSSSYKPRFAANTSSGSASDQKLPKRQPPVQQAPSKVDQTVVVSNRQQISTMNQAFVTPALRRQPIRPFIQPTRTPIDKIIDYIIGDGPSNRFALICCQCKTHNGMALGEEFYNISFICFNCGLYNPARNTDSHLASKDGPSNRLFLTQNPISTPFIRTATNSESSDDESVNETDTVKEEETEDQTSQDPKELESLAS